jgi:hypothetical protein
MAISNRRGAAGRRGRMTGGTRRASKKRTLSPSSFRGKGAIPSARRTLARNARKVSPKLNREVA